MGFFEWLKKILTPKQEECECVKKVEKMFPEFVVDDIELALLTGKLDELPRADITDIEIPLVDNLDPEQKIAEDYGYNVNTVKAIAKVESSGSGFREYSNLGYYPTIRFEPHWFNKYEKKNPMPFTNNGKGFSSIAKETNHVAYKKALSINESAAIKATSFGKFQIMGFHYKKSDCATPQDFLLLMHTHYGQLKAFLDFVATKPKLVEVLKKDEPTLEDFKIFAKGYNGSGNVKVYSEKILREYNKLK